MTTPTATNGQTSTLLAGQLARGLTSNMGTQTALGQGATQHQAPQPLVVPTAPTMALGQPRVPVAHPYKAQSQTLAPISYAEQAAAYMSSGASFAKTLGATALGLAIPQTASAAGYGLTDLASDLVPLVDTALCFGCPAVALATMTAGGAALVFKSSNNRTEKADQTQPATPAQETDDAESNDDLHYGPALPEGLTAPPLVADTIFPEPGQMPLMSSFAIPQPTTVEPSQGDAPQKKANPGFARRVWNSIFGKNPSAPATPAPTPEATPAEKAPIKNEPVSPPAHPIIVGNDDGDAIDPDAPTPVPQSRAVAPVAAAAVTAGASHIALPTAPVASAAPAQPAGIQLPQVGTPKVIAAASVAPTAPAPTEPEAAPANAAPEPIIYIIGDSIGIPGVQFKLTGHDASPESSSDEIPAVIQFFKDSKVAEGLANLDALNPVKRRDLIANLEQGLLKLEPILSAQADTENGGQNSDSLDAYQAYLENLKAETNPHAVHAFNVSQWALGITNQLANLKAAELDGDLILDNDEITGWRDVLLPSISDATKRYTRDSKNVYQGLSDMRDSIEEIIETVSGATPHLTADQQTIAQDSLQLLRNLDSELESWQEEVRARSTSSSQSSTGGSPAGKS